MFQEYFGIPEDPFSITPDTKYLYLSNRHRVAYAHLLFGVAEGGGFVQLTGEVGTGKTLLCRNLLAQLPQEVDLALIFNPRQTPLELVASLCDELHIQYPLGCTSIKEIVGYLNACLLESHRAGRRTVLIIDEAQNLSYEALEQVRLLTNLETAKEKLLQIILVGQPELRSLLARPELRQLAQRITARYHLTPLTAGETRAYVQHRLEVAGYPHPLFTSGALRLLYRLTGGVPRLINVICSRAMLAAFGAHKQKISRGMLRAVAREIQGDKGNPSTSGRWVWATVVAAALAIGLVLFREPLQQALISLQQAPAMASITAAPSNGAVEDRITASVIDRPTDKQPVAAAQPEPATQPVRPVSVNPVASDPAASTPDPGEIQQGQASVQPPQLQPGQPAQPERETPAVARPASSLSLVAMLSDVNNAFATLFAYWQTVYPMSDESLTACERAEQVGLNCIYGKGGWANLDRYNRPAVIELRLDNGERYHVVVTALDDRFVTLDLQDRRTSFSRAEIERLWTGSYILLWRPPKLKSQQLQLGSQGEDVAWLIAMLDQVEGKAMSPANIYARFDQALKERVVRFQQSQGLMADGIVGRQTLIQLNLAVNHNSMPLLRRSGV